MLSIGTKALIACIAIVMGSSCMSSDCKGVPTGFFRMPSDQRWAEFQKFDFERSIIHTFADSRESNPRTCSSL